MPAQLQDDHPDPMMSQSDQELIACILEGDKEMFAELIHRYQQPVYNVLRRYTGNGEEAKDLAQEVFVRAYDKLWTFRRGQQFFPWLYTIAVNRARDWQRRSARSRSLLASYHVSDSGDPDAEPQHRLLERRELAEELDRALTTLPEITRELLIYRYRHDRSLKEAATVFSLSESAVKMRLKRGLEQLQSFFDKADDDEPA